MAGLEVYGFYTHTYDASNVGHLWLTKLTMDIDALTGLLPVLDTSPNFLKYYTETSNSAITTEQVYPGSLDQIPLQ